MNSNKLIVSHAPFWHDGDSLYQMNKNILLALLPATIFGIFQFGATALGVVALSVATAMLWEYLFNRIAKQSITIGDLDAAVIGMIFGMMLPANAPWWLVLVGTFVAIFIGKMIFGGRGANPFHPALVGMAFLMLSWKDFFDFDAAYLGYHFDFTALAPLPAIRFLGTQESEGLFSAYNLLMGQEIGAIGAVCGLGLILGGVYLILRGYIRWEISISFIAGILLTAFLFNICNPEKYADPMIHLFSGYTLLAAFFLMTENSSSPVQTLPMFIYGLMGGMIIILMRNIGSYADGTVLGILLLNLINPLLDNIRPKALGKGVNNA